MNDNFEDSIKFNNESNVEKIYSYDEEIAEKDAGRNSFNSWATNDKERRKQYITWGPIVVFIPLVIGYLLDMWIDDMPLPLLAIMIIAFFYVIGWAFYMTAHPYKLKYSMSTAYVLTKQKDLYMIFGNPNKIGQNLAILIGVPAVTRAIFKGNKTAQRAATGVSMVAVGINVAEKLAKLNKFLSDPVNIDNVLNQPNLMKELYVFKIVKTIGVIEKKNYYKGKFLIYDCNKARERHEVLNIGKAFKDYNELINQFNLRK